MSDRQRTSTPIVRPILWLLAVLFLILLFARVSASAAHAAGLSQESVRTGYREVLGLVASGDQQGALDRLVDFEAGILGDSPPRGDVEEFWRYKLRVISDLMRVGSLGLAVPVMVLHHDAYPRYLEERHWILASHSRTMAIELADLYMARAARAEAGKLSASVLISLAGHHQLGLNLHGANSLFAHALELDPQSTAASMGLATNYEKNGQYEDAIPHLRRVVEIDPGNGEARLRLAMCTRRIDEYGKDEEARQILARLLRELDGQPEWIASLVYQELGNLEVAMGRLKDAERTLRQGLERFPDDQHLQVRLAMVLKRAGRRSEASSLMAAVRPLENYDSPRRRYNAPSMGLIDQIRADLRTAVQSRLQLLALSLGESQPGAHPAGAAGETAVGRPTE